MLASHITLSLFHVSHHRIVIFCLWDSFPKQNRDDLSFCLLCCYVSDTVGCLMMLLFSGIETEWESRGHDTPDSAGRIGMKTAVYETLTPPSFKMRDENFIAFSTPAEGPAVHPLQPVTDQIVSAAGGPLKSPGKPRKPRAPKAIWTKTPGIPCLIILISATKC